MKKTLYVTMLGIIAMSLAQSHAAAAGTTWVQHLNFTLAAWQDGVTKPFTITTKELIQRLNGVILTGASTELNFSKSAQLLVKQDLTNPGSDGVIVVRDGKPSVDTDVSELFSREEGPSVTFATPSRIGKYSMETFQLMRVPRLGFNVSGLTIASEAKILPFDVFVNKTSRAEVSGTGFVSTAEVIIRGTISVSGGKLE